MTRTRFFALQLSLLAMGALCIGVYSAFAEEHQASTTEVRETVRDTIMGRREEVVGEILEKRAEIASTTDSVKQEVAERRAMFAKKMQERLYNLTHNITGRMDAALFRLDNIAARLATRTEKLKQERNIDATNVDAALARARESIAAGQVLLVDDLGTFAYDENPREAFGRVRTTFSEVGGHIRTAHMSLQEALQALKAAVANVDGSGVSEAVKNEQSTSTNSN